MIESIVESFTNNLIVEDRYRMILDGLQVTLLITLCAAVLGTLLGGLVCWMRMSRRRWLQQVARVYIDLIPAIGTLSGRRMNLKLHSVFLGISLLLFIE